MSIPDFNIAKFNIPVKIKRAFDKGKIADSYKEMYMIADKLATLDASRYHAQKLGEYMQSKYVSGNKPSILDVESQTVTYKDERLAYHMEKMIQLLEYYATSRETK